MKNNKGIYIWEFDVLVAWSYDGKDDDGDLENYTVTAPTFDRAWAKVKTLALSLSRKFTEEIDDENGNLKKYTQTPLRIELQKVERGNWIDG